MTRLLTALALIVALALPAGAADLSVFAAASLSDALAAIKADYEQGHPGTSVTVTNAASGALLRRMQGGETADLLVSADTATMDEAVATGRVDPASRVDVAGNTLVLAVPAGNPAQVVGLESLTLGGVRRVGVGNPESVPAGRYAKRALSPKALWFALTSKLVYFPSVRHVLSALAGRDLDAGFVYRTDAVIAGAAVDIVATFPLTPPVVYVAAKSTTSRDKPEATAFLTYLTSPAAREVLSRFGFTTP
jgi:molybdate transport system substrate-binding protein